MNAVSVARSAPDIAPDLVADVVVAGIGLGAIAAALAVAGHGLRVVMAGPESRIGGQVSTQLTSPLDEHPLIETTGCTARYREFRDGIRAEYGVDNPGDGWVSRLCFEPLVGERVLHAILAPAIDAGLVTVLTGARPIEVERGGGDRISAVRFATGDGELRVAGEVVVDATETGDLLPLAGADWVIGSEGRDAFDEPHALPGAPDPSAEQSCTIVAALVRDASPHPVGDDPEAYAAMRDAQPFSLTLSNDAGSSHDFAMFDDTEAPGSFWSYRRVRSPELVGGPDTAIINWHGNDWYGSGLVADPTATDAAARRLADAFVHWLRTEAPRDDGGRGHPELRLAPEVSGTPDGFAESPYVRESRRLRAPEPVTEHDLAPRDGVARAHEFDDAVGVAWYHADLHPRVGGHPSVYAPTAPFQVPLRSLVAGSPVNLVAGAKNLAATQIAAAAYRVHPGEWAIGEAAGELAAASVRRGVDVADLARDARGRVAVQVGMLRAGAPIVWASDLSPIHPAFLAGSLLIAYGGLDDARRATLDVAPDGPLDPAAAEALRRASHALALACGLEPPHVEPQPGATWAEAAIALATPLIDAIDADAEASVREAPGREPAGREASARTDRSPEASRPTVHHSE
ncbi:FAD-dependent oxidoreductase [Agromyces sp. CFH 90414]|uniref:FAD-dependent oxidoreductase n=1 Tax=Agromyces agglutinans TaxID=2662258 RepID=A0A6I2F5K2_9MICO|nr:FAD-dependent oxidoreductase [Agromyces agglutinans]MRG60735.1 FAD-dependent oxidoreductase [Agromyces agglutinans]